ncbi:acyl-CoA synthetase (NDP forming) [Lipingzhangella halophila]|uniref:Acyl-CoA synthetase (NDP forming) n=1 Tax=Lipingzhangella halophila TaxID=1783352 RepID=A0A7W7RF11_9ACTN|nr:acetate--CoA ligase family protein [Lipingzhangella halophila]MBB4930443.1 acyl-CoA synthetase (NDP forming) [Lipingzhangella halophila]
MTSEATVAPTGPAERIRALFNPRSVALVGATDKSLWSWTVYRNMCERGFSGPVHLVNPTADTVHGAPAHPSVAAIGEPVDLAYVMVPTEAVLPVVAEAAEHGTRSFVILTAGFGETGTGGRALEAELVDYAHRNGLLILGPNGNGYINAAAGMAPFGLPFPQSIKPGGIAFVLQSGALTTSLLSLADARDVGLSLMVAMGNEAMLSLSDVVDYLVDDPATKVIALFVESIRDTDAFRAAAQRALRAGKPVVAIKVGRSQAGARAALAHTGSLVGDDSVVDAAFRQMGVIRVRSLEELVVTSGLLAATGELPGARIGVVSPSGGACDLVADRAADEGLEVPEYHPETVARLREILPEFARAHNPLDVTGYILVNPTLLSDAVRAVAPDPGVDLVLAFAEPPRYPTAAPQVAIDRAKAITSTIEEVRDRHGTPVVLLGNVLTDVTEHAKGVREQSGMPHVGGGIEMGVSAVGHAVRWSRARRRMDSVVPRARATEPALPRQPGGVWAEHQAIELLSAAEIPTAPTSLARDAETAAAAASRIGFPVVVKVAAPGLAHKSDIGGVRLGLRTVEEVRAAHEAVVAAGAAHGEVLGSTVQPYRPPGGVELIVGVVRDPLWGAVLAVGLGGVWVEVLGDSAQRLLPVTQADVRDMLAELRGAELLRGVRGQPAADLDRLVEVVLGVGALAHQLGERLESLEINPLRVSGTEVEALDALVVWRE